MEIQRQQDQTRERSKENKDGTQRSMKKKDNKIKNNSRKFSLIKEKDLM